jgi:hypothetical protein
LRAWYKIVVAGAKSKGEEVVKAIVRIGDDDYTLTAPMVRWRRDRIELLCTACKAWLLPSGFWRDWRHGVGRGHHQANCKRCMLKLHAAYRVTPTGKAAATRGNKKWRMSEQGKRHQARKKVKERVRRVLKARGEL